jgi:two-component system, cell cycle response regulator CpdR
MLCNEASSWHFFRLEPNYPAVSILTYTTLFSEGDELSGGDPMGQSQPFRATALIVEDDPMQREMICVLLEESDFDVIQCDSAEAAETVIDEVGGCLSLLMTDVNLAGRKSGVELAHIAKARNPRLEVVVTSGRSLSERLPDGAKFWAKPWAALDVLREAQIAQRITEQAVAEQPRADRR